MFNICFKCLFYRKKVEYLCKIRFGSVPLLLYIFLFSYIFHINETINFFVKVCFHFSFLVCIPVLVLFLFYDLPKECRIIFSVHLRAFSEILHILTNGCVQKWGEIVKMFYFSCVKEFRNINFNHKQSYNTWNMALY